MSLYCLFVKGREDISELNNRLKDLLFKIYGEEVSNTYNAEIFLYKPWRPKEFFQYIIIINVLFCSFCII